MANTRSVFQTGAFESGCSLDWLEFTLFLRPPQAWFDGESLETITLERNKARLKEKIPHDWTAETVEDMASLCVRRTYAEHEEADADAYIAPRYRRKTWEPVDVPELFGYHAADLEKAPRGAHGYMVRHTCRGVGILSSGSAPGMGMHVTLSGDPLKDAQKTGFNPVSFLSRLKSIGGKPTRIDGAADDFDGKINLPELVAITERGEATSPLKNFTVIKSGRISDGTVTGLTLYFGSRESDVFGRIYDKRLEQIEKGIEPRTLPEHWIRVEIQVSGDAAENLADRFAAGEKMPVLVMGLIANYFRFRERGADSNKSRWKLLPSWSAFLAGAVKVAVARTKKDTSLEDRSKWLEKQVAKSLAMVGHAFGSGHLSEIFVKGQRSITEDDEPAITAGRKAVRQRQIEDERKAETWKEENAKFLAKVNLGAGI